MKQDVDSDIAMLGIPGLKRDPDELYDSSDPDEAALGPRMNIDRINLVSEDEDDDVPDTAEGKAKRAAMAAPSSQRRRIGGGEPIRLQRKEHEDRTLRINTEASSATSAALRKKAEEASKSGQAGSFDEALTTATRKARTRSKDVEVVGDRRRWKGVWEDDANDDGVKIKQEPEDESLIGGIEPGAVDTGLQTAMEEDEQEAPRTMNAAEPEPELETKAHVRAKLKQKKKANKGRPAMYQTPEEIREWDKRQEELALIQQELGRVNLVNEDEEGQAQEGDLSDRRVDSVYLFQLPSVLPDLVEPAVKKEPQSPTLPRSNLKPQDPGAGGSAEEVPIKVEDDDFGGDLGGSRRRKLTVAPGLVGKLRIHKSGRSTFMWGGTNMEMKMGVSPYFLQTAILTRVKPPGEKTEPGANDGPGANGARSSGADASGGKAISFGQIRGKLVVLPAWSEILGERGLA